MSNLSQFLNNSVLTHIKTTVQTSRGRSNVSYDANQQQFVLDSQTKILKIMRVNASDWNILYSLDGSNITTGSPGLILNGRPNNSSFVQSLRVNGGETFKHEYSTADGAASSGSEFMIFEEWKY